MKAVGGKNLCQPFHCSSVLSFRIHFISPCDRSTAPIVWGCFSDAGFIFTSNKLANSDIDSEVKFATKSLRIV